MELRATKYLWKACENEECSEHQNKVFYPSRLVYIDEGKAMSFADLDMRCMTCGELLPKAKDGDVDYGVNGLSERRSTST